MKLMSEKSESHSQSHSENYSRTHLESHLSISYLVCELDVSENIIPPAFKSCWLVGGWKH